MTNIVRAHPTAIAKIYNSQAFWLGRRDIKNNHPLREQVELMRLGRIRDESFQYEWGRQYQVARNHRKNNDVLGFEFFKQCILDGTITR